MEKPKEIRSKRSTVEREDYDADNEQDYVKADKGKAPDYQGVSLRLDDSGIPIPPPSSHAENWTPMPASLPNRPKARPVGATYVRALTSSKAGTKPHFDKGDILRVIGEPARVGDIVSLNLLSLKPPREQGYAPTQFFRVADQEDVDEVGRRAGTEEEKAAFRMTVEFDE